MGIVIRQSVQGTIVNYIGAVFGAVLVLFVYPLCLTPEMIGLTRLLTEFAVLFSFFAQAGMSNTFIRFFPSFKDESSGHHHVFFWTMVLPLCGFVLVLIVFLFFKSAILLYFAKNSMLFTHYYYLGLPLALFWVYITMSESLSSVTYRVTFVKFTREVLVRVAYTVCIVLYYFQILTFQQFLLGFVAVYGLNAIVNLFYLGRIFPIRFFPEKGFPDKKLINSILRYMGYVLLIGMSSTLVTKVDTFMISGMSGLAQTGIYSIAFFMVSFLEIPYRSVLQISIPILSENMEANKKDKVLKLYQQVTNNQILISGVVLILIWVNLPNIFLIMPKGDVFSSGKWVVLFLGLTKLIDSVTGLNAYILSYSKYYRYSLWLMALLACLTVCSNLMFIPKFGITGAAVAAFFSFSFYNTIVLFLVWKRLDYQPFMRKNLKSVAILLFLLFISFVLPYFSNPYIDTIVRSSILVGILLFLLLWFKPSVEINSLLQKVYLTGLDLVKRRK